MLAAIAWTGAGDASSWTDVGNWDLGRLPAAGDNVSIPDVVATSEVHLSGTQAFDSLASDEALRIQGADVTVSGSVEVNNALLITSATVNDATILPGAGFPQIQVTSGTTLRNTTVNADIDIVFAGGIPTQIENLTLNGTLSLNDGEGITFIGPTLDGTGEIVTSSASTNPSFAPHIRVGGSTLTIGPHVTIQAFPGAATFSSAGSSTLINHGRITADGSALSFDSFGSVDVVNHGTIEAVNGGRFSSLSSFNNAGIVQAVGVGPTSTLKDLTSSGVIRVDGGLIQVTNLTTQPGIDLETANGGQIRLINVHNVGNTVTLDQPDDTVVLQGGTWEGGTIDGPGSLLWGGGGKLKDVVMNANASTFSTGGPPSFENLVLNGTITDRGGFASNVTQTLLGSGEIVFNPFLAHFPGALNVAAGTTLTLGPDITVRGNGGFNHGGSVSNEGTIVPDVPGSLISVSGPFTQTAGGSLEVPIGGVSGSDYGFLRAANSVTLDGGLQVSFVNGFTPGVGQSFFVVDKISAGSVTGTFAGLPEGTVFSAGGVSLQISYTGHNGNDVIVTVVDTAPPVIPVDVDVKPANARNKVNAKSQGVIPIAIYTTADFDATTIDVNSVRLTDTLSADHIAWEDVDDDGDLDLILHFRTQDVLDALGLDLDNGDSVQAEIKLTGETVDEVMFEGGDAINFFRPGKGKGKK